LPLSDAVDFWFLRFGFWHAHGLSSVSSLVWRTWPPESHQEVGRQLVGKTKSVKTYNNIYPEICAYENLHHAWRAAVRGKRRSPKVASFEYALTDNLLQLEEDLREQRYQPGAYRHFRIRHPKPRRISAARQ
jgi:hypothetical protein